MPLDSYQSNPNLEMVTTVSMVTGHGKTELYKQELMKLQQSHQLGEVIHVAGIVVITEEVKKMEILTERDGNMLEILERKLFLFHLSINGLDVKVVLERIKIKSLILILSQVLNGELCF